MFNTGNIYGKMKLSNDKSEVKANTGNSNNSSSILSSPDILTGLSHEVRTYMNSIVAFSFLQSNGNCNTAERQEYTDHILSSCDQLITLFDNFLDSAMLESEDPKATIKKIGLQVFLQNLSIELNSSLSKFDKNSVSLVLEEVPSTDIVFIDEEKISRVIRNLFQNAMEHTDSGYIKLGFNRNDGQVIFYVLDSGIGYHFNKDLLSGKNLPKLLTKNNNTFNTVGLILAQKLIETMGGRLWIEPNGVKGSGVYFSVLERKVFGDPENDTNKIKSRIAI